MRMNRLNSLKKRRRSNDVSYGTQFNNENILVGGIVVGTVIAMDAVLFMGLARYISAEKAAV